MATLRELIIKISANSSSFQSEISRASRMGSDYYKTMEQGGRKAAAASRESQRSLGELNNQLATVGMSAKNLAGIFAGLFTVKSALDAADQWGQFQSRIKMTTSSAEEFLSVQQRLLEISDRTYKSIDEQAELYIRSSSAMKDLGYNTEGTIDFIDSISSALTINAASAEKGERAINALSKSMVDGKVTGESWKSVMEVMPTAIGDISRYLGITETAVKKMAAAGKLSMKTFADAVISAKDRNAELAEAMPTTIGDSFVKLQNHFKTYVADANKATGTTATISGVISTAADNMELLVTATGGFIALGVVRYLGKTVQGFTSSTLSIAKNVGAEIGLAEAQLRGTQVSTARSRAAVYRAQQAVAAARGTDTQAAAEKRLAASQTALARNIAARSAAQANLNSVTAIGTRALSGALGLVGGIPGLVMLGAGAWYAMYQNQEQARKSAQEYAKTLDQVREKLPTMSLPDVADNQKKTEQSLAEQNRLISEQQNKVKSLLQDVDTLSKARENPAFKGRLNDAELIKGVADATEKLGVEQARLNQMEEEAKRIKDGLAGIEYRRVDLLRQQTAVQNKNYQSLIMMNGQYSQFNTLMSLGNNLLRQRQGLGGVVAPFRIAPAELNDAQAAALKQSAEDAELSKLKGKPRATRQAELGADKLGLTNTPQYSDYRNKYISDELTKYDNDQANKPVKKGPKTDAAKEEDAYKRIIKQQKEQIALIGQSTELAKMKYEISQGELTSLSNAKKEILLQNAALLDQKKVAEQLKTFREGLVDSNESAKNKGDVDFSGFGQGQRARDRMKEMISLQIDFKNQQRDLQQDFQRGDITEDLYKQETQALRDALNERLEIQGDYYKRQDEQREDWMGGISDSLANYVDESTNYAQMAADATSSILGGVVNELADGFKGLADRSKSVTESLSEMFEGLGSTVIDTLLKMGAQWLVYEAVQLMVGKTSQASATAAVVGNATASSLMAQLNAYASTAAIPIIGPAMAPGAAAAAAAVTTPMVAAISTASLAGMAHDGIDKVPETGTWLLQKGERVTTAATSAKLDATLGAIQEQRETTGGEFNYSPTIQVNGDPDQRTLQMLESAVQRGAQQGYALMVNDLAKGQGKVSKAIGAGWNTKRRAR